MGQLQNILWSVVHGFKDAGLGATVIWRLSQTQDVDRRPSSSSNSSNRRRRPNALRRMSQCGLFNGCIFLLSILLFRFLILSWLYAFIKLVFGEESNLVGVVWSWLSPLLSLTFGALWVLPLFLISRIVNALWFQDIADSAFKGRPQSLKSLAKFIADTLFSLLIQALFLIQAILVASLPIPLVGTLMSLVFMSLLYALYSFEYKWLNLGWELPTRIDFIEKHWPYFLGFGLPLAIMTSLCDNFVINGCIFSILFPFFILSGNEAKPQRTQCTRFPFFTTAVWMSNEIFHGTYFVMRFVKSK